MKYQFGLEISTEDTEVLSILGNFGSELLKMGKGVTDILAHAEAYPDNTLIQAYCATVYLYGQNSETDLEAEKFLNRAHIWIRYPHL